MKVSETVRVKTSYGNYDVIMEDGALSRVGEFWDLDRNVLIVTDDGVPPYAETVAKRSKDPSSKKGCVIVDEKKRPVSFGYNGFL